MIETVQVVKYQNGNIKYSCDLWLQHQKYFNFPHFFNFKGKFKI